jgi:hypothetical protein
MMRLYGTCVSGRLQCARASEAVISITGGGEIKSRKKDKAKNAEEKEAAEEREEEDEKNKKT